MQDVVANRCARQADRVVTAQRIPTLIDRAGIDKAANIDLGASQRRIGSDIEALVIADFVTRLLVILVLEDCADDDTIWVG